MLTDRQALWMAHIAAVLFGLTGIFGALIDSSAEMITFGRALFAVAGLFLILLWQKKSIIQGITRFKGWMLLLSGSLLAIHWVTFFIAVKVGGVSVATLGFASFPAFITIIDWIVFKDRITQREWVLLLLVSVGLILVTPQFSFGDSGTIGLLWGILSGFSFGLLAVVNKRGVQGIDAMQVAFWQNSVVMLLLFPFVLSSGWGLSSIDWFYLALLGIFCTGLSHYLFVKSLESLNARIAGMIIALEPVYAIGFAWWLFGSTPTIRMISGAALILFAIAFSSSKKKVATETSY
ncbi:MAG TPA: DMT family transporter [Candidatus Ignatzschineria merdigallinarum]|uniref:DMT family transporter n=1 Tax=Candidatus Ignatzschineria merdigallinarum TaxID=2838621 RepID=A0A9D1TT39_9GAMM|nr:DMT family transporter [Candidatus Ignatzschineria merdigallinarum]